MKNKTIALMVLSILSVIAVLGMASATTLAEWPLNTNGVAINVLSGANAGTFTSSGVIFNEFGIKGANAENWTLTTAKNTSKYFEVTISPQTGKTLTISDVRFDYNASIAGPASFELQYSKQSGFGSPTSLVTKIDVDNNPQKTSSNTSLNIQVNSGETLTLRWFGYKFDASTNEFLVKSLNLQGTVTVVPPVTCGSIANTHDNLRIKKISFTNDGFSSTDFGKDDEWFPIDEITTEMTIENRGNEKIEDIELSWGLYDPSSDQWVIEFTDEDTFSLSHDKNKVTKVTFSLDNVDMDLSDLSDGDYVFYVQASGYDTEYSEDICTIDSKDVKIIIETDFVVLNKVVVPETVSCGADFLVSANVWNIGEDDQEGVYVNIYNKELKINQKVEIGDVNAFSYEGLDATVIVPNNATTKTYGFIFSVYNDNDDLYVNDYSDDESAFTVPVKVTCTGEEASGPSDVIKTVVSASLESGGKAGGDLVIKSTITNLEDKSVTYTVSATGYTNWASSANADQNTFILASGESKAISFTFAVKDDVQGEQAFDIEVVSGGKLVTKQPVSVSVEKAGFSLAQLGGSNYIWAIALINIILVVVIIIVAIRVMSK